MCISHLSLQFLLTNCYGICVHESNQFFTVMILFFFFLNLYWILVIYKVIISSVKLPSCMALICFSVNFSLSLSSHLLLIAYKVSI
jgi:hypothetical protein